MQIPEGCCTLFIALLPLSLFSFWRFMVLQNELKMLCSCISHKTNALARWCLAKNITSVLDQFFFLENRLEPFISRADKFFSRFCEKPLSLPQFMTMKLSIEPAGCYFTLSVLTVADFEKMALVSQNEAWEQQFPELSNSSKVQLIRILHNTTTQEIEKKGFTPP